MNQAANLIKSVINKTQTIEDVATMLVLNYAPFVYELSKIIDQQFRDDKSDIKVLCISLVCEILRKSHQTNCAYLFVKGLAQRLRYFLHAMSRNYVSQGQALQINRNIDSLKYKGLFYDEYFEKLQTLARKIKENSDPANSKVLQKSFSSQENIKNYSRTFLSMMRDINKCQSFKPILDSYFEFVQLDKENPKRVNMNRSGSIDLQNSWRESEDGKGSLVSSQVRESRKQRLERVIKDCHKHILSLQQSMGEQVRKYEESFNTSVMRGESQCNLFDQNQTNYPNE